MTYNPNHLSLSSLPLLVNEEFFFPVQRLSFPSPYTTFSILIPLELFKLSNSNPLLAPENNNPAPKLFTCSVNQIRFISSSHINRSIAPTSPLKLFCSILLLLHFDFPPARMV